MITFTLTTLGIMEMGRGTDTEFKSERKAWAAFRLASDKEKFIRATLCRFDRNRTTDVWKWENHNV